MMSGFFIFENDAGALFGKCDAEGVAAELCCLIVQVFVRVLLCVTEAAKRERQRIEGGVFTAECHDDAAVGIGIVVLQNRPCGAVKYG